MREHLTAITARIGHLHSNLHVPPLLKQNKNTNTEMLGTAMPTPAEAELNPDDKVNICHTQVTYM
jgi:hypothetical protein